ncbi:LamG-like jellyroll fold domain-containing protein [Lacipirellula sp.]|uniref:LamG-like jellyroll fold domain-containing protein n=1 Tax=Lacipirellula sp. TaxID=2691419 RepID=UPI003D125BD3
MQIASAYGVDDVGLVGYWKIAGDCRDYSGGEHHGTNHGVHLSESLFDGNEAYIEIPDAPAMQFGKRDFSISADVYTDAALTDVIGDIVTKFDGSARRGLNLTVSESNPGYNSQADTRNVFFGVDDGTTGQWQDCGRPGGGATHISDALTVFDGHLYAGTTDGEKESDWAHVYRYDGNKKWIDCGRLGDGKTRGVYAMIVHDGELYAATTSSHGQQPPEMDAGRVYRYRGEKNWEDLGAPGKNCRVNALATFNGKLYAAAFNINYTSKAEPGHCYVYEGGKTWRECGEFNGWPHSLAVNDGRLYAAYPQGEVYEYDGTSWRNLGNPHRTHEACNQIHSLGVYRGELYEGSWPQGRVAVWRNGQWIDLGQLGDSTEVIGLTVYNGCFYAGTIPRAEVFRFDPGDKWTSVGRLYDPPEFEPAPVGSGAHEVQDWTRASSLAVFDGKLFSSTATCYREMIDPAVSSEARGTVYSYAAGAGLSLDRDLGAGWHSVAAVRRGKTLSIYADGKLAMTRTCDEDPLDVSNAEPLLIGNGPQGPFSGKIREVRLYNRALADSEVLELEKTLPDR